MTSGVPRSRAAVAVVVAALALVHVATAAAYWDYQGNLPKPDGTRHYLKYTNATNTQQIRMSWTAGSHCMQFLRIEGNGTWFQANICGDNAVACTASYDCHIGLTVYSVYDRFGCYNPGGLSTVWVNCRATNPL